ncbi:hypothetical protein TheetDRAFT_1005 [Thermoanaerobacter ethanolicus JW 200]|uniref:hypothetical protein n=1 Tax=Thermoanaerobacter ethanolicus TaxID=1757 RepID=UPI000202D7FA|nr:hypothetical protein TheetDRAFT_1005 [Thermoanaerobacter ethanolicus JW 200]
MKNKNINTNYKWILHITIITFFLATILNFFSDVALKESNLLVAFCILGFIVLIGIIFDIIGTAVISGREEPFHTMAAKKVFGAKEAIKLLRNANIVANFCNDVVGDISGIVSGAALMAIIVKLAFEGPKGSIYTAILGGLLSAITIGGKAIGKNIGIAKSQSIVYTVAVIFAWIEKNTGIKILPDYKNNKRKKRK